MFQTVPRAASDYARATRREQKAALAAVRRQWRRMDREFDLSWSRVAPTLVAIIAQAQARTAALADEYVPDVLEETGQARAVAAAAVVNREAFVGVTGSGVPVADTLALAPIRAKQAVADGQTPFQALRSSGLWLTATVGTILSDTGRAVETTAMAVRPVGGYVRMLQPPSCGRCAVLAGRWYRTREAFQRHPQCFPAGVVVSGPSVDAATRRWYEGELVVLTTASGEQLPVTGNHPILTGRGWVPANLLREGDEVVRSTRTEGAAALVVPDHDQMPARIEDVWRSLSMAGLDTVPTSPEDFHGDGQHGEVDIVWADGSLDGRRLAALIQQPAQANFAVTTGAPLALNGQRTPELLNLGELALSGLPVGGGDLGFPFEPRQLSVPHLPGFAHAAPLDASLGEHTGDGASRNAVLPREGVLARSGEVLLDDLIGREIPPRPRWDAPAGAFLGEGREGYTARGLDLLGRLSGQVELDRVVKLSRSEFRGHVYSLQSSEGWHVANSLIVSNCDCRHIPASEGIADDMTLDLHAYLDSLDEAGQIKVLGSKANLEAWRDYGADPTQIINAYRGGMRTAQDLRGNRVTYTTDASTRRSVATYRMRNASRLDFDAGAVMVDGRARLVRRMPETILRTSRTREAALHQLRLYGWIA